MEFLVDRSNFINVALLNWGKVMAKVHIGIRVVLFVTGNPLTARSYWKPVARRWDSSANQGLCVRG